MNSEAFRFQSVCFVCMHGWPFRRVGRGSRLVGSGSAVPKNLITNEELSKFVDTSDEWISVRTGIRSRRVLGG